MQDLCTVQHPLHSAHILPHDSPASQQLQQDRNHRQWNAVRPPNDGHKDARNMLRNKWLPINHYSLHLVCSRLYLLKFKFKLKVVFNCSYWFSSWGSPPVAWSELRQTNCFYKKQVGCSLALCNLALGQLCILHYSSLSLGCTDVVLHSVQKNGYLVQCQLMLQLLHSLGTELTETELYKHR